MRPPTACVTCRDRRRKCEITDHNVGCVHCVNRKIPCSLAKTPATASPPMTWPQTTAGSSPLSSSLRHHRESVGDLPPPSVCEELVHLYLFHINDKFHSLFHSPTLIDQVAKGAIPKVLLLSMLSLSARFSNNSYFTHVPPRMRGKNWAQKAAQLLNLRDVSLITVQACVLLGACAISESEASAEAVYYSVAGRMAMLLDLPNAATSTRLEKEVNIRVWWSLCMIDVWSSAGVRLPRSIPSPANAPLPMDDYTFLQLRLDDCTEFGLGYSSEHSLLTQMIHLNSILAEINAINELAASTEAMDSRDYSEVDAVNRKLEGWLHSIPTEMHDTQENLESYSIRGLGTQFVAVYLGYYNYGQMLYYQFLHDDCHDAPHVKVYATKCKEHATALCEIIYRSYDTPGCEVTYTMVGHILVIASSIQLHTLLFDTDEDQIRAARRRLERNFEILTKLQTYWPSLDICFSRLKEFHKACQNATEESFKMDQWMLKFLLEFAKPIGEKEMDHLAEPGPWSMQSFGIYSPPLFTSEGCDEQYLDG